MFQTITRILKWSSMPILAAVALLSSLAGRYEGLMNLTICLVAIIFVQRAAWLKEYSWGAMCIVIAVVFSPLFLVTKIFVLMGITCIAACATAAAAFRPQPVAAL